jgi:hypothetical protein
MLLTLAILAGAVAPARCEALIADYGSWREAPGQAWDFRWPAAGAAKLTLIGAEHRRDPAQPQFARISAAFAEAKPTLVFFEGPDRGVRADAETTIRETGESGYARFLAKQAGIPARSLEPFPPEQMKSLLAQFPADQVFLFFVLREAARLRDREGKSDQALDAAVAQMLTKVAPLAGAAGVPLPFSDVPGLGAAAARYWPKRDWRTFPGGWFSPLANDKETGGVFLGAVNRADSNNRNRHMVRLFSEAVKAGERPFVVVGRNHVPMQARALACALSAPAG